MSRYERKDRFYRKAKEEGRASRAFYKLWQIQQKYGIIKCGDNVVDLGCAPGGWLEDASRIVGDRGKVIGIDIEEIKIRRPNVFFIHGDISDPKNIEEIERLCKSADAVLSDMSPKTSGIKFRDSALSYELAVKALAFAEKVLKPGGNFVVKIFPGAEFADYKKPLATRFREVAQYRPPATRQTSIEVYLVCRGYIKIPDLHVQVR